MPRRNLSPDVIIAAAADMADQDGFDSIVMSAVARELGVQTASLYGHLADRAAVLDGVHELALTEISDAIADAVAGRSRRAALIGLGHSQRDYARRAPGRWEALQRRASADVVESESARRVADLCIAVVSGYGLSGDDIVHAVRLFGATVNGFISLERTHNFNYRSPATEDSWSRALDALDHIFTSWEAASPSPPSDADVTRSMTRSRLTSEPKT